MSIRLKIALFVALTSLSTPAAAQGFKNWGTVCTSSAVASPPSICATMEMSWTASEVRLRIRNEAGRLGTPPINPIYQIGLFVPDRVFVPEVLATIENPNDPTVLDMSSTYYAVQPPTTVGDHAWSGSIFYDAQCKPRPSLCNDVPWEWQYSSPTREIILYQGGWFGGLSNRCSDLDAVYAPDDIRPMYYVTDCGSGWVEFYWKDSWSTSGFTGPLDLGTTEFRLVTYDHGYCDSRSNCVAVIPEPSSVALLLIGLCAVALFAHRRRSYTNRLLKQNFRPIDNSDREMLL